MAKGGFWGKILHVNLNDNQIWTEELPNKVYETIVGGRGLIAYMLLKHTPPKIDPLGDKNLLIFSCGPFQGTSFLGSGRHAVGGKSPLTNCIGSSEAGGYWGNEFKKCGWDALVVHGKASDPKYISIEDDRVEIREADYLWGKNTLEVEDLIKETLGDEKVRIAQCGIAGENLVRFASVMHDINRAAGRNGLGAVMGSKRLKAVVVKGSRKPPIADKESVMEIVRWMGKNHKAMTGWLADAGTAGSVVPQNHTGGLPTKNFAEPQFDKAENIDGLLMKKTIVEASHTCNSCPIKCKQVVSYKPGETFDNQPLMADQTPQEFSVDASYGGPEYETLGAFGSGCKVGNLLHVAKANELCAKYGIDTISMGMTLSFAMECVEKNILKKTEALDLLPEWGDGEKLIQAIEATAFRNGYGDQLAEGSKRLAALIGGGAEDALVEVRGQEMAFHEPRAKFGHGLGVAVCPVGADHMINMHDDGYIEEAGVSALQQFDSVKPLPVDDLSEEKVKIFYYEVNKQHFYDCAVLCMFYPYNYEQLAQALSGVTGNEYTSLDIVKIGERTQLLCMIYNQREGISAAANRLPKRVMEAFSSGPLKGNEIEDSALKEAIQHWYRMMGCSVDSTPQKERLDELSLSALLA